MPGSKFVLLFNPRAWADLLEQDKLLKKMEKKTETIKSKPNGCRCGKDLYYNEVAEWCSSWGENMEFTPMICTYRLLSG